MQDTAVRLHRSGKVKSARGHVTNNLVVTLEVCGQSVCYWPTNGGNESLDAILPKQGNYDVHLCFSVAVFFLFFLEIIYFFFLSVPKSAKAEYSTRDFLSDERFPQRREISSAATHLLLALGYFLPS